MDVTRGHALLSVWFGGGDLSEPVPAEVTARWFRVDPAFDELLRAEFGDLLAPAREGLLAAWEESDAGTLALVLVLDQLHRNLHRGDAGAFAGDPHAVALAERALARGIDRRVSHVRRAFFYLPFEHAEDLRLQDRAVACFEALAAEGAAAGDPAVGLLRSYAEYAERHRDLIRRFGRFPHRNAALARTSSADEERFLSAWKGF